MRLKDSAACPLLINTAKKRLEQPYLAFIAPPHQPFHLALGFGGRPFAALDRLFAVTIRHPSS